jgi:hypothetical protein
MCGGEYKMAALHGRMDKKVIFLCILWTTFIYHDYTE